MAGSFTSVDLSQIPAPVVVEVLDHETIVAQMLADLRARDAQYTATVESDPAYKILEVVALREMLLRQRVNDAARAVMVAYALDGDLDNLGALMNVKRLTLDPGDPLRNIPPTMESNTDYRRRIVLAPEGFSVAGPEGAYVYHALSASPQVLDASAASPKPDDIRAIISAVLTENGVSAEVISKMNSALDAATWPGEVIVTVLARAGDGSASAELVDTVAASVSAEDKRPMTDHVTVSGAQIIPYQVKGKAYTYSGPDASVVLAESLKGLRQYVAESHRLGRDVTMSGLYAAAHVNGIQRVEFEQPAATIFVNRQQAAYCDPNAIELAYGGTDE